MNLSFSFIIPVYNRPDEIRELLESIVVQTFSEPFEIVIIEDGSTETSERIIDEFRGRNLRLKQQESNHEQFKKSQTGPSRADASAATPDFTINYLKKPNSGPGHSRNYGMARAKGNFFIILDSDCILPPRYLEMVSESLRKDFVHCYGGPDAAHESFSLVQKAINYAMTAVLTTGGIRGSRLRAMKPDQTFSEPQTTETTEELTFTSTKPTSVSTRSKATSESNFSKSQKGFQPRSFNMGLSRLAFESTSGFGNIHPGEDPDLIFRMWRQGYSTRLIPEAFVYHKRRIDWKKFYSQVKKFGMVRPILNRRYPKSAKMTYWFPALFSLGFLVALVMWAWGIFLPLGLYAIYFILIFTDSLLKNRSLAIALLSMVAVAIQFAGYGFGFLKSAIFVNFSKKKPEIVFPGLFFKNNDTEKAV